MDDGNKQILGLDLNQWAIVILGVSLILMAYFYITLKNTSAEFCKEVMYERGCQTVSITHPKFTCTCISSYPGFEFPYGFKSQIGHNTSHIFSSFPYN